jgi:hypothetical protein
VISGDTESEDYLRDFGFSESMIDRFFRPFFGGVFLEKDLRTSAAHAASFCFRHV